MKKIMILTVFVFAILTMNTEAKHRINYSIDVNIFFSQLEPYGEWIEIGYDEYVWRPFNSDYNWKPYSEGRWEWTKYGWYWVSYEPFGWATYHYGRWYYDDYYGWVWMPDNVWAPAWVEWRYNDIYVGWAPLPPYAKFSYRSGIYFSVSWKSDYYYWNFVRYNHFISHNIHSHFLHNNNIKKVFRTTKRRTNYFLDKNRIINAGINRKFVERKIGRKLTTRNINRTDRYNVYEKFTKRSSSEIIEYKPKVRKGSSRIFDKTKIKRGKGLTSLKREKVVLNKIDKNHRTTNTRIERKYKDKEISNNSKYEKKINKKTTNAKLKKKSTANRENKYYNRVERKENKKTNKRKSILEKKSKYKNERIKTSKKKTTNLKREVKKKR